MVSATTCGCTHAALPRNQSLKPTGSLLGISDTDTLHTLEERS